ncbi:MAG: fibronectin type III domain-containing protein [Acutalibacteraceae bacterium]
MKRNVLKRTVSFVFALVLLLSSFCVPALVGAAPENAITASAATTKPAKVTGLKATAGVTSVSLSWKKVSGASGYNICRYDTAKKRYVSVANVTDTKATVKKLEAATAYRFAVRAYKKSGKNISYGELSSQVIAVTRPYQVKGIKAARTENSILLKWNPQNNVTGYVVYRYDTAKKKYVTAAKTKSDTVTINGLKAGTTYYFVIRAYVTVSKTNYYSSLSDKVKVQTLKTGYKISKYHKIVSGGTYTMEAVMKEAGSSDKIPFTFAYKNGNFAMKSTVEGMDARIIYNAKSAKTYLVLDQMRTYTKLTEDMMGGELSSDNFAGAFAAPVYGNIKTGTKTISGKKYYYESFNTIDSGSVVCYFSGSTIVRVDSYDNGKYAATLAVKKFTSSVDESLFKIPKYYAYINLSWADV